MPDQATALLQDPMTILAFLAGVVAVIFWLSSLPALRKLFARTPPVMYVYFVPMLATTAGITPASSEAYEWLTRYLLPFALLLLMISIDLKSIARLGPTALFMVATLGVPVAEYWHWQFLSLANFVVAPLLAITGVGCFQGETLGTTDGG